MGFGIGDVFGAVTGFFRPEEPKLTQDVTHNPVDAPLLDARAARTLVLGRVRTRGASVMWHQTHAQENGDQDPKEAYTAVLALADHPCSALRSIWIGDKEYSIGTLSGGEAFVLASESQPAYNPQLDWFHGTSPTWSWYVPNENDRGTGGGADEFIYHKDDDGPDHILSRFAFRWFNGTQTVPDQYMDNVDGTGIWKFHNDGGVKSRVFNDICYLAYQVHQVSSGDTVDPSSNVRVEMDGANDIYDWRLSGGSGGTAYTNNLILCCARWMQWRYGPLARRNSSGAVTYPLPGDFDADEMKAEADYADELVDIKGATDTQTRHNVSAIISADQSASQVRQRFVDAAGGLDIFRRPDTGLWTIRFHRLRPTVVAFNRTDTIERDEYVVETKANLPNTITGVYRHAGHAWQKLDTQPVTDATYLSEDNGLQRTETLDFDFLGGTLAKFRAERAAQIYLDTIRHPRTVRASFPDQAGTIIATGGKGGVSVLEPGDWVELTDDQQGWTSKTFRTAVVATAFDERITALELQETSTAIRWDDEYDPNDAPISTGIDWWKKVLAAPTGLSMDTISGSGGVQADGTMTATVTLSVTEHPDLRIRDDGEYLWRVKKSSQGASARTIYRTRSERFDIQLQLGVEYKWDVQVRALDDGGMSGSGRGGGVASPWSAISTDTPVATIQELDDAPLTIAGANMWGQNWDLENGGLTPKYWILDDSSSTMGGVTSEVSATGGFFGDTSIKFVSTSGVANGSGNDDYDLFFPKRWGVLSGEIMVFGYSVKATGANGSHIKMRARWHDRDGVALGSLLIDNFFTATTGEWEHRLAAFQVEDSATAIARVSVEYNIVRRAATGSEQINMDGFHLSRARRWGNVWDPDDHLTTALQPTWSVPMGVANPIVGSGGLYSRGDMRFQVTFNFEAFLRRKTGNAATGNAHFRYRCVRYDTDTLTNTEVPVSIKFAGSVISPNSDADDTEYPDELLAPNRVYSVSFEDSPDPDTTIIYRLETTLNGDNTNFEGVVRSRQATIEIVDYNPG